MIFVVYPMNLLELELVFFWVFTTNVKMPGVNPKPFISVKKSL